MNDAFQFCAILCVHRDIIHVKLEFWKTVEFDS